MTNEMTIFNYGMNEVRTVLKDGQPWFVARDVADVLEIQNIRQVLGKLDEDEKLMYTLYTAGQNREVVLINEAGLYSIILTSRKPEAKSFKRWVTHDVIPSIRKNGAYMTDDVLAKTLEDPNYMVGLISNLAEERNKRIAAEEIIQLQEPKVQAYDDFMSAKNTMTITEVGKIIGLSGIALYRILRDIGIILKSPYNAPAQEYLDKGYFKVILKRKDDFEFPYNVRQTRVTASGVEFIYNLLKDYRMLA